MDITNRFIRTFAFASIILPLLLHIILSLLPTHTHAQTQLAPTLGPSSASANDQRLIFTADYCSPLSSGGEVSVSIQTREDPNVYLIACFQGLLIFRWNQSTSTMLTFPNFTFAPLSIVQQPLTDLTQTSPIFFPVNGSILSLKWDVSNKSTLVSPPMTTHAYNRTVCPYVCNFAGLVFSADGSVIFTSCGVTECDFQAPAFVVAIDLNTTQTIAINTTWAQSHTLSQSGYQNISQISLIDGTNELLIVSQSYGITVYETSQIMEVMRAGRSSSVLSQSRPSSSFHSSSSITSQVRVLLNNSVCSNPLGTVIDRSTNLLMSLCNNQTIVWNLTSPTNISVDPQSGVVVYPQTPSQVCLTPSLRYHRPKRTLYQSCNSGPDRVFALQNLNTPQSALFTSLVNVDTCSSTSFMMTDRTQPDVLYAMCAEGMIRMEGRGLTPISTGSSCQQQGPLVYDWRTDSTYVTCGSPSPPLLRLRNNEIEFLMVSSDCPFPQNLIFHSYASSPQLFLICVTSAYNNASAETTVWNISLALDPNEYAWPQILFSLPGTMNLCSYSHLSGGIFYCFWNDQVLYQWNVTSPNSAPQENTAFDAPSSFIQVCADWLFFSCQFQLCLYGTPLDRISIDEPTLFFGNGTQTTASFSTFACDNERKSVYVAISTLGIELIRINVSDTTNPIVDVYSFDPGMPVNLVMIDIDTVLNRVYIPIVPSFGGVTLPDYLVVFDVNIQRFISSIQIARLSAPTVSGLFVDSHTSQVFMSIGAEIDSTYDQVRILTSGWRCTTGTSWYQGSCLPCPIGKNRSVVLSTDESTSSIPQCGSCGSGGIADSVGTIECNQCQVGRYADPSVGQVCSLCVGGFYSNTSGSTSCQPCECGRYSNTSEASSCWPSDPGSYVSAEGQSMQFQCPPGSYTNTSAAILCQPCDTGRYAADYGTSHCTYTIPGSYQNQRGQNSGLFCPSGRFSNTSGVDFCYECDAGTYTPFSGVSKCIDAYYGSFVDQSGQTAEALCPSGRFSNITRATLCLPCEIGQYASTYGRTNCTLAGRGFYVDQLGQNSQQPCPPGTFNNERGSTSCYACAIGTFANMSHSTSCWQCDLGHFSASAASECPTCSADAYTPRVGADCISCTDQEGLICINGLASVAVGWWPYLVNDTSFDPPLQVYRTTQCPPGYCDGATLQFSSSSSNNEIVQLCTTPRLNSPDNWLCAECEDGYIAWGSSCEPCTGPDVGLICGALILTFIIAYVLLRIDPAASPLTILFFFVQIAALEVGSVTRWIDWIQLANLGAHSFQRCLAPLTPVQQMILTLCIPFLLTSALGLICALHRLISKYVTPSRWYQSAISSPQPSRFTRFVGWCSMSYDRDRYLGAINAILIFCYTPVTVTVVSALHCSEVGPDVRRLFSTPSVDCHSTEYRAFLLPFVYVWLCCYVIGLPIFMLIFVWWRWQTVASILAASDSSLSGESMDQVGSGLSHDSSSSLNDSSIITLMPAQDSLLSPDSNPNRMSSHSFDARWGHFYRRYRLTAWYWQPIEMLQRFAFALTSVLLIKNSRARYSLYSTISIISLSANLWSHPFASERMNHVALVAYFLLSFVSFLLNGQEPPYSLTTQLMFFGLIVPFSIILLVWGVRLNVLGMQKYMQASSSSSLPPPHMSRSESPLVPSISEPSSTEPLLSSFSVRL